VGTVREVTSRYVEVSMNGVDGHYDASDLERV
jgi:hypothetical protein